MAKETSKKNELTELVKAQVPKLTQSEANKVVSVISQKISIRSAPYPNPEEYERYHLLDPDLTRQMKEMVLKEQEHQHDMDNKYLDKEYELSKRGQIYALLIFVMVILLGCFAIYRGFEWGGTIITSIGVVGGIIAHFLKKRK